MAQADTARSDRALIIALISIVLMKQSEGWVGVIWGATAMLWLVAMVAAVWKERRARP